MLKILFVSLSMLLATASAHAAGLVHHPAPEPVRGGPGYAAEYSAHDAAERSDATPPPDPQPSVQEIIAGAFAPLGPQTVSWAEQIAWCESKYDPAAVNADSNAQGLFQFLPSTWAGTPFAHSSPFDPVANAGAAAWLLQAYGPGQWECRA